MKTFKIFLSCLVLVCSLSSFGSALQEAPVSGNVACFDSTFFMTSFGADFSVVGMEDAVFPNRVELILICIVCLLFFCGIMLVVVLGKKLRRSDAKLHEIFDDAGDAMRVIDLDFKVIKVNKKYVALSDMDQISPGKYKCMELVNSTLCNTAQCPLAQIKSKKAQTVEVEVDVTHHSKRQGVRHFILTATPYRNEKGETIGIIENFKDITERKKAKLISEKARVAAESVAKIKSDFLANMSHEIRTPMNGVVGMTELLMDTRLTAEQFELVETIAVCGENLLTIINDILNFSKIEAGKMLIETHPFDLQKCVQEVFGLLAPKVTTEQIAFSFHFSPDVPTYVLGDVTRLKQVLMNLLGNSIKFTSKGEIALNVDLVEVRRQNQCTLQFAVKDTGVGIPEEAIEGLFETFSQVDSSTTRKFGGTGLGLAISHKLVALMGGNIEVHSQLGEGTEFSFTIDVECADALPHRVTYDRQQLVEAEPVPINEYKLLLVEDNPINKKLCLKILAKLGYDADSAENGVEALECMEKCRYDLVFMDLQMPEMDGLTCVVEIIKKYGRGLEQRPVIVAMTANAMPEDRDKCLRAGMDDYLSKPVKKQDIVNMLKQWQDKMSTVSGSQ